jgi:uncharacterized Zn finger protein
MITVPFLIRQTEPVPCTIEIEHTGASLHAHVELDSAVALRAGDRVRVHGEPVRVNFGQKLVLRREATVERAGWLERQWTRFLANFELSELYEVSFTPGRLR